MQGIITDTPDALLLINRHVAAKQDSVFRLCHPTISRTTLRIVIADDAVSKARAVSVQLSARQTLYLAIPPP